MITKLSRPAPATKSLAGSLALLQEGMHQLNVGVSIYDADFLLVACNKRFLEMFNLPKELVQEGAPLGPILRYLSEEGEYGPIDCHEFERNVLDALRNMTEPMVFERRRADGLYYEAKTTKLDSGGYITIHTDITHRKQREAELEARVSERTAELLENKKRLDAVLAEMVLILKNASLGIFTIVCESDGRRVIRRANLALERMLGYEHGQLEGQDTRILYPDYQEYCAVSQSYTRQLCTGQTYQGEHVFQHMDGRTVQVAMSGSPIDPEEPSKGVVWLVDDITERKRLQAELAAKAQLLKDGTDNMPGMMVIWDSELRYLLWTPNAEPFFNLPPGTLQVGLPFENIIRLFAERGDFGPGDVDTLVEDVMGPLRRRETLNSERHLPDGRVLEVRRKPLPSGGYVSVAFDITENKRLEGEILRAKELAERAARQVASLLNNSGQGFLSFGSDLVVDAECSRACETMLGVPPAGRDAAEVIYAGNEPKADLLRKTIPSVLAEDDPWKRELMLSLMAGEFQRGGEYIESEYKMLENEHVMAILTDITKERQLKARVESERRHLEMIVAAVTDSRDFFDTVNDFRAFISHELSDLLRAPVAPHMIVQEIYRQVHTFKGLLNQFSFEQVPKALHELESRLDKLKRLGNTLSVRDIADADLSVSYESLLDADLTVLREALGDDFVEKGERIVMTSDQAEKLEELASHLLRGDPIDTKGAEIRHLLQEIGYLRKIPIKDALVSFDRLIKQTAERLEKEVEPVRVEGGENAWVDPNTYRPFLRSLVHVFRNAVVHGIETPDIRLSAGKHESGLITCNVSKESAVIRLRIADDGAGINLKALREKAVKMGAYHADVVNAVSDDDILDLIFLDNVSTRFEATMLTGRGVGLAVVKKETKALGGEVIVRTSPGKGTEFLFVLPVQPGPTTQYK